MASIYGDLRVYDIVDEAKRQSAEKKAKTGRIKKK